MAVAIVTAAALVRLLFAALIPAFPDETYYWEWSRHLAPGYFDHPPMIAVLIRAGTLLMAPFGSSVTPLAVRLVPIIAGWIAALATVGIARRVGDDRAAVRAAVLVTVLPLAAAGLVLATPDAPLLAATAVGLYCLTRALETKPRSRESLAWWTVTGLALGIGFSSKFTSIFLPIAVLIAVAIRPTLRARLREPGPYVACVVATLVFFPVLLWNARHDWIAFVFQLQHGLSSEPRSLIAALRAAWRFEGDFFGGQAGLVTPILFVLFVIVTGRALSRRASDERFVLATVAIVSFAFFVYSAARKRVEPNWPAPAYIPAIVLLATTSWGRTGERWFKSGVVLAAAMSLLIYAHAVGSVLPIVPRKDPIARAYGWDQLTERAEASARRASAETGRKTWLAGDRYQEASELAFHAEGHPITFAMNLAGRSNQYDLWPRFMNVAQPGDNLVLVLDEPQNPPSPIDDLAPSFGSVERGELVVLRRGDDDIAIRRIWILKNLNVDH